MKNLKESGTGDLTQGIPGISGTPDCAGISCSLWNSHVTYPGKPAGGSSQNGGPLLHGDLVLQCECSREPGRNHIAF